MANIYASQNVGKKQYYRMRRCIREIIAAIYVYTGLHCALMRLIGEKKVAVIVYHDPSPEIFQKHFEYLKKHFTFISLNSLFAAIQSRDWSSIPRKSLVLTFDDGHKGNYHLLGLFQKFGVVPTIYLCSHIINTKRYFWWKNDSLKIKKLKKQTYESMMESLQSQAGFKPEKEYRDRQALNIVELREMSPFVNFGSHTRFHPILTRCPDEVCFREIAESKTSLEELLKQPIEHFVYPNGDYEEREIEYLKACGYKTGRTLDIGRNGIYADPYRLKAVVIEDDASLNILRAQLSGFFSYLRYIRHGNFRGMRPSGI